MATAGRASSSRRAAALVVWVPPTLCLVTLGGPPTQFAGWAAYLGPFAAAVSVLVSRRHVEIATVLLAVAIVCVPPAESVYALSASTVVAFVSLAPLLAVGVVTCALGAALPIVRSLLWLGPTIAFEAWVLGWDMPFLMIAIGWWLVGRVLRSGYTVAASLRARATELAQERDRYTAEAVRLERTKIARELHDVVAHCMTVIVIQSRAGQQLLSRDPAAAEEVMESIVAVAAEAAADIGALVELMHPEQTRPLTRHLLDELVTRAAATGAAITAEIIGNPDDLDPGRAIAAHRLVQEALTNAFRHAPGAAILIEFRCLDPVTLDITNERPLLPEALDTRVGSEVTALNRTGAGRGLIGLRERVAELGGEVGWGPTSSGGWRVAARLRA